MEQGWRPRRTIIIASWDGGEYARVGSTEWVEDNKDWLSDEAVAYINVDSAVSGPNFRARASPLMRQLIFEVTNNVVDPLTSKTVLQAWKDRINSMADDEDEKEQEQNELALGMIPPINAASDDVAFAHHLGISSMTLNFFGDYGVKHSNYDSIYWMEHFGDPTYEYHRTMVRLWGMMLLRLSSDWLLPMHPIEYANELSRYATHISDMQGCLALPDLSTAVASLQDKARHFEHKLRKYQHKIDKGKHNKKLRKHVAKSNERLAQFERAFIDPAGLPGREWYKHVVYAPHVWNAFKIQVFPSIHEAMKGNNPAFTREMEERTAQFVNSALSTLRGKYDDFLDEDDSHQDNDNSDE